MGKLHVRFREGQRHPFTLNNEKGMSSCLLDENAMYKLCKSKESVARQKRLEDGLLQAMKSQPFESISASDLCKQLGVPRNTFYRYFSDKKCALLALIDHTLMECNSNSFNKWSGNTKVERRDLETFFIYWNTKREFIDVITKNGLCWMLIDRCNFLLDQRKNITHFTGDYTDFAKEQAGYIFLYVMMTVLLRWSSCGFLGTPQEVANATYKMFGSFDIV